MQCDHDTSELRFVLAVDNGKHPTLPFRSQSQLTATPRRARVQCEPDEGREERYICLGGEGRFDNNSKLKHQQPVHFQGRPSALQEGVP